MAISKWNGIAIGTISKFNPTTQANTGSINLKSLTDFVSSWKTDNAGTSSSTQITIPTVSTGTYNCVVYWGDGNSSTITTYNDAAWTHTYSGAATYTVTISNTFAGIKFNNGGDRLKLLGISQWGRLFRIGTNEAFYFYGIGGRHQLVKEVGDRRNVESEFQVFQLRG